MGENNGYLIGSLLRQREIIARLLRHRPKRSSVFGLEMLSGRDKLTSNRRAADENKSQDNCALDATSASDDQTQTNKRRSSPVESVVFCCAHSRSIGVWSPHLKRIPWLWAESRYGPQIPLSLLAGKSQSHSKSHQQTKSPSSFVINRQWE